ncbi:MAG: hypothetical protein CMO47_05195 [Verrucomicrobiales bacterium]|nr:hypothetical protein [Verrucomicrobiales bacterium]|tara:strand:- start:25327 stop:25542 length:216 start_codon:yes stop_codon:yes gene_type:complete
MQSFLSCGALRQITGGGKVERNADSINRFLERRKCWDSGGSVQFKEAITEISDQHRCCGRSLHVSRLIAEV